MGNVEVMLKFFEAENNRDWQKYREYLQPDIEWTLFSVSESQSIKGINNYMDRIQSAYEGNHDSFICQEYYSDISENRIVAILCNSHNHRSIDIFDFENSLIKREYEFLLDE